MIVLKYNANGFPLYWIDTDDPLHGFSLWRMKDKNTSELCRSIPASLLGHFNKVKQEYENRTEA